MKHDAWSVKHDAWLVKHDAWSVKHDAWSVKRDAWSVKRDALDLYGWNQNLNQICRLYMLYQGRRSVIKSVRWGTIGGNRRKVAAPNASLGAMYALQRGLSTFLTKNSRNENRKMVERRTIADPKWARFLGFLVGRTFPMLSSLL